MKKIRYSKQLGPIDCGPTAIINLFKWAGVSISYRDTYKDLCKYLKVDENRGTKYTNLFNYLNKKRLPVKLVKLYVNKPNKLEKYIKAGYAAVIGYSIKEGHNHVALVTEYKNNRFNLINHHKSDRIVEYITKERLKKWTWVVFVFEKREK